MPSLSSQLANRLLPDGLAPFIATRRQNGDSWHSIAFAFSSETGVVTTGETIRRWAGELGLDEPAEVAS